MSLTRALTSAQSGLAATSLRADIAAGNIANANTAGYVRRELIISENVAGNRGNGVRITGVERHQDIGMSRLRRESDASFGRADIVAAAYTNINSQLGEPGDAFSLFTAMESLESSLRELATTPESSALQNSVVGAGRDLVNKFNTLSQFTSNIRNAADHNINLDVKKVNETLHDIHSLNTTIAGLDGQSLDVVALEDERQRLIDSISEIIPVNDISRDDGRIDLITDGGVFLLAGKVNELSFQPAGKIPPGAVFNDGISNLSGLFVDGQNLSPGTGGNFAINSGTIAGYFAVRDNVAPTFNNQLDSFAADLITRFSNDALDPTKAAGAPGIFTDAGGPADTSNLAGIAGRLRLNTAIDPYQGGDIGRIRDGIGAAAPGPSGNADLINSYLDALGTSSPVPASSGLSGNATSIELIAGFTSIVGESRIRNDAILASAATRNNLLTDAEIQKSGVDIDFEMQSLLLIEQSYAANARVIQTIDEMIDRLLQL